MKNLVGFFGIQNRFFNRRYRVRTIVLGKTEKHDHVDILAKDFNHSWLRDVFGPIGNDAVLEDRIQVRLLSYMDKHAVVVFRRKVDLNLQCLQGSAANQKTQ